MNTLKDAKYGFGRLIDLARAHPLPPATHRCPVVVVMAAEKFERSKALDARAELAEQTRRAVYGTGR